MARVLHFSRYFIRYLRLVSFLYLVYGPPAHAAFTYTAPAQCENLTVNWSGGKSPFSLLLAPHLQPARNISIPSSAYGGTKGSYTFQLQLASQVVFLMVLSDSTGFGSLGTTSELTVNTSSSTCDTSTPSAAFTVNFTSTNLQQCRDFTFDGFSDASKPITIHGLIPQGTAFDISIPSTAKDSYNWTANIALGTTVLFVPQDSKGNFADNSDFLGVGSSSISTCVNGSSPQTTIGGSAPSSTPSNTGSGKGNKSSKTGAVVGGVLGAIAVLLISLALLLWGLRRRKRRQSPLTSKETKGYGKARIDLLQGGELADTGGEGEDEDGAARYPLSTGQGTGEGPHNYEPVPYLLPPGEPTSDGAERSSISTRPLSGGEISTVAGASSAAGGSLSKAALAALDRSSTAVAPNTPARFLVHQDAGSLDGDEDEEGEYSDEEVVDLPPQYNSLGVLISPERRPSRRRSTRRPVSGADVPGSSTAGGNASTSTSVHVPVPPVPTIPSPSTDGARAHEPTTSTTGPPSTDTPAAP